MLNIALYGEHTLSVEAITRLIQDESELNLKPTRVGIQFLSTEIKYDIFIYCTNGYSNTLVKEITKLHRTNPDMKLVLVMSMAHKHFLKILINAGVNSIISYKSSADELIQGIKYAALKQQFISTDLSNMVIKSKYPSCFNSLSQRELEITYLLANGMNIKNVSAELDISPKTVNTYRYRIFNKLAIERNVDLFRIVSREAAYMLKGYN